MTTPPVIFIIFNRTDTTRRTFERIRAAQPKQLLVIADGPRADKLGEAEKCAATRAIIDEVDWDCEVHRNFSATNMTIRARISSGLNWAFEIVDRAVILEHDCLPSESFFNFCSVVLERYEDDERVMMIAGQNHLFGHGATKESYYFSRYPHMWGWATWRRAWEKYDLNMTQWPAISDAKLFDQYFPKRRERHYWESVFQYTVYNGRLDTWDYQWCYSMWANSGLSVTPSRSLVENIGLDSEATHTNTTYDTIYATLRAEELDFPLTHPANVLASVDKDVLEGRLRFKYHTKGLLGLFFRYLALKVVLRRVLRNKVWRIQRQQQ